VQALHSLFHFSGDNPRYFTYHIINAVLQQVSFTFGCTLQHKRNYFFCIPRVTDTQPYPPEVTTNMVNDVTQTIVTTMTTTLFKFYGTRWYVELVVSNQNLLRFIKVVGFNRRTSQLPILVLARSP